MSQPQLLPNLRNADLLSLVRNALSSCRCDGGGSLCAPCASERCLEQNGVNTNADNLKSLQQKLEFYRPTMIMAPLPKGIEDTPENRARLAALVGERPTHFNKLTPAQAERLAMLAEECGEVVLAVGKILRHGYESYHPNREDHLGNKGELELELGDIMAIVQMMEVAGDISTNAVHDRIATKKRRVMQYAHHQGG